MFLSKNIIYDINFNLKLSVAAILIVKISSDWLYLYGVNEKYIINRA